MTPTLSLRYLWWKEAKQLLPLIAMLLAISIGLHLFFAVVATLDASNYATHAFQHVMVGLGMPALFAAGAGALIVGQEREQRTLDWLRSLPISPRSILLTKLTAGLIGLVVVWLLSSALAVVAFLSQRLSYQAANIEFEILPVVVNSFFILAVGFTTAWLLRSAFISLLLVVPLATVPMIATIAHDALTSGASSFYSNNPSLLFIGYSILFCALFSVWAWRQGKLVLGVEVVKSGRWASAPAEANGHSAKVEMVHALAGMQPALLWQFAKQNAITIVGLAVLFFTALIFLSSATKADGSAAMLGMIGGVVATSWLGQLVFQSDAIDRRHLFLAGRGIPAWQVWLTRQLIPLAILAGGATFLLLFSSQAIPTQLLLVSTVILYAASQFLCQFLRSPILGVIVSPLFATFCAALLLFGSTPLWLISSIAVFFTATFLQTRSWMDGHGGWRVSAQYLGWMLLALSLPLSPWLTGLVKLQRLSSQEYQRLEELSQQAASQTLSNLNREGPAALLVMSAPKESDMRAVLEALQVKYPSLSNGFYFWRVIPRELLTRRLRLEQSDTPETNSELLADYRVAVDLAAELARRLRNSTTLSHQNEADKLEIALLEELRQPQAAESLEAERYAEIRQQLQDTAGRQRARQFSLAADWKLLRQRSVTGSVEAFMVLLSERTRVDALYSKLLKLTEAATDDERQQILGSIKTAELFLFQGSKLWQPAQLYIDDENGVPRLLYTELSNYSSFGANWYGRWEQLATELSPVDQ